MKAVGIKQLKAHLSDYVRLAKAGDVILVTEREEVVAELRPARRQAPTATSIDDVLDALAESREVERASVSKKGWRWAVKGLGLSRGTGIELIAKVREER